MTNASIHKELLKEEASVQMVVCGKCLDLAPGVEESGKLTCIRCAKVEDLLQEITELQGGQQ